MSPLEPNDYLDYDLPRAGVGVNPLRRKKRTSRLPSDRLAEVPPLIHLDSIPDPENDFPPVE
jgi:hypothetical protein